MAIDTRVHMSEDIRRERSRGRLVVVRLRMETDTKEVWWEVEVFSATNSARSLRQNVPCGKAGTRQRVGKTAGWLAEQLCE